MSDVDFCAHPSDCPELPAAHGRWEPKSGAGRTNPHPKRPTDLCRAHLLEGIADELVTVDVVGALGIVDVRTHETVMAPGSVELDPAQTNIAALVKAGLVKVRRPAKPAPAATVAASAKD
jgi:hypothetical protein